MGLSREQIFEELCLTGDTMRLRKLGISIELLRVFFTVGHTIPLTRVVQGLPADTLVTDVRLLDGRTLLLTISSAEFSEIAQGDEIPWHDLLFERVTP